MVDNALTYSGVLLIMDNHNNYLLVGDSCNVCNYIANAFTLMRLPLHQITYQDLVTYQAEINKAIALIVCKNVEEKQHKYIFEKLDLSKVHLISLSDPAKHKSYADKLIHYLKMPFSSYELQSVLTSCGNNTADDNFDNMKLKHPVFEKLLGQSPQIRKIRSMIRQVAYSDSTVLILGQSGTGKDVIASCIHYLSNRRENPLVPINCGAIPSELMESELFGHEKGAFTGAATRRPGRFEIANTGTLFLDEIGDMPLPMQVKLLRVIQERTIERVGGNTSIKVDVRLIAATHKNLEELIQHHEFRDDLYYRLNVFPIHVPSLCERVEDIPVLIDYHLDKIYERLKHRVVFTQAAKEILCHYTWPGNIRELENFLERMVILHRDRVVDEVDIDPIYKQNKPAHQHVNSMNHEGPFNIKDYISNIERQMIQFALERSNGIVQAAADYLSLGKATLIEKIKKYNILHE